MSLVRFRSEAPFFAGLAHLVERHLAKVEVASSSLVTRSNAWKFSSAGRASALQAEGHRFEPCNFHHFFTQKLVRFLLASEQLCCNGIFLSKEPAAGRFAAKEIPLHSLYNCACLWYNSQRQDLSCICGSLAQLGEHLPYKQRVTGSSPVTSTIWFRSQVVRQRSAKPLCGGSNPPGTSKKDLFSFRKVGLFFL